MPSFEAPSELDRDVKLAVVAEALRIVSPTARPPHLGHGSRVRPGPARVDPCPSRLGTSGAGCPGRLRSVSRL